MRKSQAPPSVVVGIDGSKAAVRAALWAVDEAVSRDIPLRLVYAGDPRTTSRTHPDHAARKLAFAEGAIRYALMTVESTEKPVKIEAEIAQARPTTALVRASQSAAMVCVGAVGFKRFSTGIWVQRRRLWRMLACVRWPSSAKMTRGPVSMPVRSSSKRTSHPVMPFC